VKLELCFERSWRFGDFGENQEGFSRASQGRVESWVLTAEGTASRGIGVLHKVNKG